MTIKCSVRSCAHNDNAGNCYAKTVEVRGLSSTRTDETLCKSYVEQSPHSYMHELSQELNQNIYPATVKDVKCSAHLCRHNHENRCCASAIQINRETSACHTFEQ